MKNKTLVTLEQVKDSAGIETKYPVAVKKYEEVRLNETEKELLRQLWIQKLQGFAGCSEWSLTLAGEVVKPETTIEEDDDLPF